jgi:hypothetical protein
MPPERPTQDPVIAAIEARIAAWTAALDSYRAAVAMDGTLGERVGSPPGQPKRTNGDGGVPSDLPVGVFRDKSIKEAIEIYLSAGRRKQTNKEISIGLQQGGIPTTSENFEATIATALHRMKKDGLVLRFSDGWDLASSYPDSLRGRLEKDAPARKLKTAGKRKRVVKARKATHEAPDAPSAD